MITEIRKHIKSSTTSSAVIFITVLALGGVFSVPMLIRQASTKGPWAFRVNGKEISHQDFSREVAEQQEHINRFRAQYGQIADMILQAQGIDTNPQALARDLLIKQELLVQLAQSMHISINHEYISEKLNDREFVAQNLSDIVPSFIFEKSGVINQESLRLYLKHQGLTAAAFEERLVRGIYRAVLLSFVHATNYIPDYEVEHRIRLASAKKKFSIMSFSLDDYVKEAQKTALTKEEVSAYYDAQNSKNRKYWIPEQRAGITWTFDPKSYDIQISKDAIAAYYEDHKTTQFADKPAQVEVRYLLIDKLFVSEDGLDAVTFLNKKREELRNDPEQFATVAEEISIDPSSKDGGLLKPFSRGEQAQPIERAAFILQQDGDISDVIEVDKGYALIQRVSKKARTYKPIETVQSEIRKTLLQNEFKELFAQEVREILNAETVELRTKLINDLVAKRHGIKDNVDVKEGDSTPLSKALFKLSLSETTFFAEKNKGVLVQLTHITPAALPDLASVFDVVSNDMYEERCYKKMEQDAIAMKKRVKTESVKELSHEYSFVYEQSDWLDAKQTKKDKIFDKYVVPENEVKALEVKGGSFMHINDRSISIVRLDELQMGQELSDKSSSEYKNMIDLVDREYTRLTIEGLVASLYRNATIETNKEVTFQVEDLLYE